MNESDPEEARVRRYLIARSIDFLEQAKAEQDVLRKLDLERRMIAYWLAALGTAGRQS